MFSHLPVAWHLIIIINVISLLIILAVMSILGESLTDFNNLLKFAVFRRSFSNNQLILS